ncbi:hypothetical protein [Bordetella phage vB_BbrM_PHB04]|uniref:Uncharacterized protein n=1 Tax=Bordetella phage vB_BbrM_PHB04 TaxID=2029657 RepID=A0A291L9Y3_9CAUD|nr:hypothetical protein HOS14_gp062 [Bordetella phage vB_BbrM_PHB04]ATI15680.1 hypothetical protein [Bordetella phage vB_BbrM_PHB04]
MDHTNDRIASLERRVYQLEGLLRDALDELRRLHRWTRLPTTPVPRPEFPTIPAQPAAPGPAYAENQCSACGLKLGGVMMYSCPRANCPTGLGGVQCGGGR